MKENSFPVMLVFGLTKKLEAKEKPGKSLSGIHKKPGALSGLFVLWVGRWGWILYSFFSFVTADISFKTFSRFSSSLP